MSTVPAPAPRLRWLVWPFAIAVALATVLFLAGFPARALLEQRREHAAVQRELELLQAQNDVLEKRAAQLRTDAEIERIAREQYNLVKPGEEAYAILPGAGAPAIPPGASPALRTAIERAAAAWAVIVRAF
jgi:cell division protein FtsB